MPRFLRVQNVMIHIPSVSSVSMSTTCMGRPQITLSYHSDKKVMNIPYKRWSECEQDFNRVKVALVEIENLLKKVRLTETGAYLEEVEAPPQPQLLEPAVVAEIKKQLSNTSEVIVTLNESSSSSTEESTK